MKDSKDDVLYDKMRGWEKLNNSEVRELDWGHVHAPGPAKNMGCSPEAAAFWFRNMLMP